MGKNAAQQQQQRSRKFFLLTYADEKIVKAFVEDRVGSGFFTFASYIRHDRDIVSAYDVDESPDKYTIEDIGKPKQLHYHILCICRNATTLQALRNGMDRGQLQDGIEKPENTLGAVATDAAACYRYEIHQDHPYKAQYSEMERSNYGDASAVLDLPVFPKERHDKYSVMDVLNDIADGYTTFKLVQKYDNFYLRNLRNIDELARRLRIENGYCDSMNALCDHINFLEKERAESARTYRDMDNEIQSLHIRLKAALDTIEKFDRMTAYKQGEITDYQNYKELELRLK